jgi:hypothetical protein
MGVGDFKHKVLDEVRRNIILNLGHRFKCREWEETLLYSMASFSDLFGTATTRFNEKQFVKKFLNVVEIPPLGHFDMELKLDIEFYARFLAMYASKMKRKNVKTDGDFTGRNVREESMKQ